MLQPLCRGYFISCARKSTLSPRWHKPARSSLVGAADGEPLIYARGAGASTTNVADLRVSAAQENRDTTKFLTFSWVSCQARGGGP